MITPFLNHMNRQEDIVRVEVWPLELACSGSNSSRHFLSGPLSESVNLSLLHFLISQVEKIIEPASWRSCQDFKSYYLEQCQAFISDRLTLVDTVIILLFSLDIIPCLLGIQCHNKLLNLKFISVGKYLLSSYYRPRFVTNDRNPQVNIIWQRRQTHKQLIIMVSGKHQTSLRNQMLLKEIIKLAQPSWGLLCGGIYAKL